ENNTSQACVYYFHKIQHTKRLVQLRGKAKYRNMKGTFHWSNFEYLSVRND
ncbi:hypothetical protein EDC96DRAFT_450265, partial [Choanephora cucurbitarum]